MNTTVWVLVQSEIEHITPCVLCAATVHITHLLPHTSLSTLTVFMGVVTLPCQHYTSIYILDAYCVDLFQMFYCNMLFCILIP